jgi:hypothetical protein
MLMASLRSIQRLRNGDSRCLSSDLYALDLIKRNLPGSLSDFCLPWFRVARAPAEKNKLLPGREVVCNWPGYEPNTSANDNDV